MLVTAEATAKNVKRASQYGISDFISKPIDVDVLKQTLGEELTKRSGKCC